MKGIVKCIIAFSLLFAVSGINILFAQNQAPGCGTDILHEELMQTDSIYKAHFLSVENKLKFILQNQTAPESIGQIYTIPVVFHVIHLGEALGVGSNIPDSQILSALDGLNDRFRNIIGTGEDIELEFCLALRAPNGGPTTGINRVNGSGITNYPIEGLGYPGSGGGADEEDLKDLSRWSTLDYYNIWVVHKIFGGIAGYAYLPPPFPFDYDGTAIGRVYCTYSGTTLTHELGHGFNSFHTFEGDNNGNNCPINTNCLDDGDKVCDTPPHKRTDCNATNPCTGSGVWDNSRKNYMSYCGGRTRFTLGQKDRMRASIPITVRDSLLNSMGCVPFPSLDAGIFSIVLNCDTFVNVILKNYGTNPLNSVTLNWSVNNILQTPYSWTGNLLNLEMDTVTVGAYPMVPGVGYDLKAWTSQPNGMPDTLNSNDTVYLSNGYIGLSSGTYTIGGNSPDFFTFDDAVIAMRGGVCGHVVFNVRDSIYNQQIVIGEISGTSDTSTVTFQSESGDSSAVILTYESNHIDSNYTLKYSGADFVIFKGITLQSTNNLNKQYARVVDIGNKSINCQFLNCVFDAVQTTSNSFLRALVYSGLTIDSNAVFRNCVFQNGSYGLYLASTNNLNLEMGTVIENNVFENQSYTGIYLYCQDAPIIRANIISANSVVHGMFLRRCNNKMQVLQNKLWGSTQYGIRLSECFADNNREGLMANNFIQVEGPGPNYGIHCSNSSYQNIYHNSIHISGTGTDGKVYFGDLGSNINLLNNIFANTAGGYAIYMDGASGVSLSDYNNLYTSGNILAFWLGNRNTLSDWQFASSMDSNSISYAPLFQSDTDLHVCRGVLDSAGIAIPSIVDDIDGETRNSLTPDIGADEFDVSVPSILIADTTVCEGYLLSAGNPGSSYLWSTGDTTMTIAVDSSGKYWVQITDSCLNSFSDSINLLVNPAYLLDLFENICDGDSILLSGVYHKTAGVYYDSLFSVNGCDSIIATHLTVNQIYIDSLSLEICNGDSIFLQGGFQKNPGTYFDTLITVNGCDSIIVTGLSVNPIYTVISADTICKGDCRFLAGFCQIEPGNYIDTFQTLSGCDSIVITGLTVRPLVIANLNLIICSGDSIFAGGTWRYSSGSYIDTFTNGLCDTAWTTHLTVTAPPSVNIPISICSGDSIYAGGEWQYTTGNYIDTTTHGQCDTVWITQLTVSNLAIINIPLIICSGDSIYAGGEWRYTSGNYYDTITFGQCDTIKVTQLTVSSPTSINIPIAICSGDSIYAGGSWQYTSGNYYDTATIGQCDTIWVTQLTVNNPVSINIPITICSGDSVYAGGEWQYLSGNYYDTSTIGQCDTIWVTQLTVNDPASINIPISICSGDSIYAGGAWQYSDGTYMDTSTLGQCDTVWITQLTVNSPPVLTVPVRICAGDSIFIGGSWQKTPGIYLDTTVNGQCDTIWETQLSVNPELIVDAGRDTTIFKGNSIPIGGSPTSIGGAGPHTYNWSPVNNLTNPTHANPIANPDNTTSYKVLVGDSMNCIISDSIVITVDTIGVGIPQHNIEAGFDYKVYPNPTSGNLLVDITMKEDSKLSIELYDMLGSEVLKLNRRIIKKDQHIFQLDLNDYYLSPGIYNLRLSVDGQSTVVKVVFIQY